MSAIYFSLDSDDEGVSSRAIVPNFSANGPAAYGAASVASIEGAAVSMQYLAGEESVAKSSYAFETKVSDVPMALKTYRVQIDYGKRDRMTRGYSSYYMPLFSHVDAEYTERPPIYAMLPLLTQGTTAPQMPPPKINDPNLSFNWSHLIDSWPMSSKRPCSNCMHKFDSIPWFIPIKRIENYYKMDDSEHVFCSYGCVKRFLIQSGYPDRFMYLVYLNDIARNYFLWQGELLAAPIKLWLETMSIEEYRAVLCPPLMYEFPKRRCAFDARIEAKWMAEMSLLRPPFLSGTAIMEWVQNVVPRARQSTKVLYDSSKPASLLMGALVPDRSEGSLSVELMDELKRNRDLFVPWKVEGLKVPEAEQMEENNAHRIVLPPIDPEAPALIDEVARMRRDLAQGKYPSFSAEASRTSYAQEVYGVLTKKNNGAKKQVEESDVLAYMIGASVQTSYRKNKSRKRARDAAE